REDIYNSGTPRFPVQSVIRPKTEKFHDFRGYAGKVYGGDLNVGDDIVVLPSQTKSKIKDIYFYNERYDTAARRSSVTLTLEDDINISRGDMIVKANDLPRIEKELTATICWMDSTQLKPRAKYILQHGVHKVQAIVTQINHKINPDFSGITEDTDALNVNDIASVSFKLSNHVYVDSFKEHRTNGSFILIDNNTNNTAGAGFIQ
ncbi:MAG: sulfate adenylyltransferase, partial [Crocinitomicaceae bacterium]|nr:sulfate adenylyltransferase [Crocinitomicaceae bacterium]